LDFDENPRTIVELEQDEDEDEFFDCIEEMVNDTSSEADIDELDEFVEILDFSDIKTSPTIDNEKFLSRPSNSFGEKPLAKERHQITA